MKALFQVLVHSNMQLKSTVLLFNFDKSPSNSPPKFKYVLTEILQEHVGFKTVLFS